MIDQRLHPSQAQKESQGRIIRDIYRKMGSHINKKYESLFFVFNEVLAQQKTSRNKIYSIYQPHVTCIAIGKEAKKI